MENSTQHPRIAVLVPCFKRPEYTQACLTQLERAQFYGKDVFFFLVDDGSNDETADILGRFNIENTFYIFRKENLGLRDTIIDFIDFIRGPHGPFDFIAKMDNDCMVPANWMDDILKVFDKCPEVDILSPNVHPSNAAFVYGKKVEGLPYMPAKLVGGLWFMRTKVLENIEFNKYDTDGLTGAISILNQISTESEAKIGWLPDIIVEDVGHWSGTHPNHIKSKDHEKYSKEVGRDISWSA
jgi:glycosyltransferase involved in cell wall biosynthesis